MTRHKDTPRKRSGSVLRLAALKAGAPTAFDLAPEAEVLAEIAGRLGLSGLRKLRLCGEIRPVGRTDWHLEAHLGATVVQPCVVTLEPVTTRIEERVVRRYLADFEPPAETEAEMPPDETAEALPEVVDLAALAEEALALALPAFPRAAGVEQVALSAAPEGAAPLPDEATPNPFAVLAELKGRLGD